MSAIAASSAGRDGGTPEERRGRVLSGLLAAMQQPNDMRKFRGVFAAVEKIGPDDIQAALELVKNRTGDERRFIIPTIVARWA